MTTLTFKEDLKIESTNTILSVYDFLDILEQKWYLPKLHKLENNEITSEIKESFLLSKKSNNRINI